MQKKFIALAVAGLVSGAAFAQSNVTVYGVADAGYVHASGNGLKFNGIQSGILSGSRLGFKGEEALGNGLKAVFALEYALNIDNNSGVGNTGGLNARQQYVGLAGGFGQVALGRQYSRGFHASYINDAAAGAVFSPHSVLTIAAGASVTPNSPARFDNAVSYKSNSMSGFTAEAIYGFGETSLTSTGNDRKQGLSLNYANGPLNADVVYQDRDFAGGPNKTEWYLGASYDFKVAKAYGSYQQLNDKSVANADNKVYQIGVSAPVSAAGTVLASFGKLDWKGSNNNSDSWAIGYTHSLSKRTTLYGAYNRTSNDALGSAAGVVAGVAARDKSNSTLGVGIRHAF